jgi:hypothetical protein
MIGLGHALSHSLAPKGMVTPPFVGPLDAYATGGLAIWGLSYRLFTSYTGPLFRVRRTGDDELDIEAKPNGLYDLTTLSDFVGSDPWWFSQFYDQTGNDIHLTYAASGQPRGAIDGNGLAYAYAETGPNDKAMAKSGLSIAVTDSTHWTVYSTPTFGVQGAGFYATDDHQRFDVNAASAFVPTVNYDSGTVASIAGTNTGLYSTMLQVGSGGNRLNIGTASATGTKPSRALTIQQVSLPALYAGITPVCAANARIYAGGLWIADLGNTNADAIQQIGKDLYFAQ